MTHSLWHYRFIHIDSYRLCVPTISPPFHTPTYDNFSRPFSVVPITSILSSTYLVTSLIIGPVPPTFSQDWRLDWVRSWQAGPNSPRSFHLYPSLPYLFVPHLLFITHSPLCPTFVLSLISRMLHFLPGHAPSLPHSLSPSLPHTLSPSLRDSSLPVSLHPFLPHSLLPHSLPPCLTPFFPPKCRLCHLISISHIFHSSYNFGIRMFTWRQCSPSQRHSATHVVSAPDPTASLHSQSMYRPAMSQSGNVVCWTVTWK